MIVSTEIKIYKTHEGLRALAAHHRPAIEVNYYKEEPISLAPTETTNISAENGVVIISAGDIPISGDVNLTAKKFFSCFAPLNLTITNTGEETLNARIYIF